MSSYSDLIDDTSDAISARLSGSSLRRMAVDLYGDTARAGLLADVLNKRAAHVSHAALHDLRRRMGLSYDVRYVVDVPADHDAQVHLSPNGTGSLHTYTVPADAEVVIVPAGARVVQPKQPSGKPRRKRWRLDLSAYAGQLEAYEVRYLIEQWLLLSDGERAVRYLADNDTLAEALAEAPSEQPATTVAP